MEVVEEESAESYSPLGLVLFHWYTEGVYFEPSKTSYDDTMMLTAQKFSHCLLCMIAI